MPKPLSHERSMRSTEALLQTDLNRWHFLGSWEQKLISFDANNIQNSMQVCLPLPFPEVKQHCDVLIYSSNLCWENAGPLTRGSRLLKSLNLFPLRFRCVRLVSRSARNSRPLDILLSLSSNYTQQERHRMLIFSYLQHLIWQISDWEK